MAIISLSKKVREHEEIFIPDGGTLQEKLEQFVREMKINRVPFSKRNLYTWRGYTRTVYWAVAFVEAEAVELKTFVSEEKGYDVYILRSLDQMTLEVVIRLKTINLDGYTQYGIEIIRCGEDDYAGRE